MYFVILKKDRNGREITDGHYPCRQTKLQVSYYCNKRKKRWKHLVKRPNPLKPKLT